MEKNRIWVISDTHFGHKKMEEYCGRPKNFEEKIIKNLHRLIKPSDLLIHLGDFCIGKNKEWHNTVLGPLDCKKWLILGNHDKKSKSFYLNNGWDFVGEYIVGHWFGEYILFSHKPQWQSDFSFSLNIFGHFHNNSTESQERHLKERIGKASHSCFVLEHHYEPKLLKSIIKRVKI